MRYLKMLGLAVVAAASLMAFVGAGSASAATTLCKATETSCSEANMYGPLAGNTTKEIHAELVTGKEAVLKAGFAEVKCPVSTVKAKVDTTGSTGSAWNETPGGKIEVLTFSDCNTNAEQKEGCKVKVEKTGELKVHTDFPGVIDDNGFVTSAEAEVTITCAGISCIFGSDTVANGGTSIGTLDGGASPTLTANAKLPWKAGDAPTNICTLGTGKATWTAEYTLTEPLYVI